MDKSSTPSERIKVVAFKNWYTKIQIPFESEVTQVCPKLAETPVNIYEVYLQNKISSAGKMTPVVPMNMQ